MRGDYGSGKFNNYCNNQICKIHEAVRDNGTYTSPTGRVYSNTSEPVTLQVSPNLKKSSYSYLDLGGVVILRSS